MVGGKEENAMANKAIRYIIKGAVEPSDGVSLEDVLANLREGVEKLREHGTAEIKVSVPRLTTMKV